MCAQAMAPLFTVMINVAFLSKSHRWPVVSAALAGCVSSMSRDSQVLSLLPIVGGVVLCTYTEASYNLLGNVMVCVLWCE
jgi:hypothetical protein